MRILKQITLKNMDGTPVISETMLHQGDATPEDKNREAAKLYTKVVSRPVMAGSPDIITVDEFPLTTERLIKNVLDQSQYENRTEQKLANKIFAKFGDTLLDTIEQGADIGLEDAEYDFVKKLSEAFAPYRNGRRFSPFFDQLENALNVPPEEKK